MRRSARSIKEYKNLSKFEFDSALNMKIDEAPSFYRDQWGTMREHEERKVLIREDGSPIANVGKRFEYVQPSEHIASTLHQLDNSGIDYTPRHLHIVGNGQQIVAVVDLNDFDLYKGTEEAQKMQFLYKFFYNAKGSDQGMVGMLRMICTNGMLSFDKEMSYKLHHKGNMTERAKGAIELYQDFEGSWRRNTQVIERLGNATGDRLAISDYIGDGEYTNQPLFKGERWAKKIQTKWQDAGEPTGLWDLYNMMTHTISHEYGHEHTSKMDKMAVLNRDVRTWQSRFKVQGEDIFQEAA
jgi:hypothetical protein